MTISEEARIDLCNKAFAKWGISSQAVIAMEECSELAVAISHWLRGRDGAAKNLAEEIADVELVCLSLRQLVSRTYDVDEIKERKWERLFARLSDEENP